MYMYTCYTHAQIHVQQQNVLCVCVWWQCVAIVTLLNKSKARGEAPTRMIPHTDTHVHMYYTCNKCVYKLKQYMYMCMCACVHTTFMSRHMCIHKVGGCLAVGIHGCTYVEVGRWALKSIVQFAWKISNITEEEYICLQDNVFLPPSLPLSLSLFLPFSLPPSPSLPLSPSLPSSLPPPPAMTGCSGWTPHSSASWCHHWMALQYRQWYLQDSELSVSPQWVKLCTSVT